MLLLVAAASVCVACATRAAVSINIDFYDVFGDVANAVELSANDVEIATGVTIDIYVVAFEGVNSVDVTSSAHGLGVYIDSESHTRINDNRELFITFTNLQGTMDSLLEFTSITTGSSASNNSNLKDGNAALLIVGGGGNSVQVDGSDASTTHSIDGLDPIDPDQIGPDTLGFTGLAGKGGYEVLGLSGVTAVPEPGQAAFLVGVLVLGAAMFQRHRVRR